MPLISHLGNDIMPFGTVHHQFHFLESSCHWLFYIYMDAHRHGAHGNGKVREIGSTHTDRFDFIPHYIEHFPKILKMWDIRKHLYNFQGMWGSHINIAQSNYIGQSGRMQGFDYSTPSITNPATGQINFIIWCDFIKSFSKNGGGYYRKSSNTC